MKTEARPQNSTLPLTSRTLSLFFCLHGFVCSEVKKKNLAQHLICSRFKGATAQWYIETDYRPH